MNGDGLTDTGSGCARNVLQLCKLVQQRLELNGIHSCRIKIQAAQHLHCHQGGHILERHRSATDEAQLTQRLQTSRNDLKMLTIRLGTVQFQDSKMRRSDGEVMERHVGHQVIGKVHVIQRRKHHILQPRLGQRSHCIRRQPLTAFQHQRLQTREP